jgi:hypothetical protein
MPAPESRVAIEQLGKFQIREQFREGQNASAFEAFHTHLNREVFLKLYDYSDSMASDVLREPGTRTWSTVQHRNSRPLIL